MRIKHTRSARRAVSVTAGAAALLVATSLSASAHHCYKLNWAESAYTHLSQDNTPWEPMSVFAEFIIGVEVGLPQCVGYADQVVQEWMVWKGLDQEPLIHQRATAGGGAAHQGKDVPPFAYLGEADGPILNAALEGAIADCLAAQPA